MTKVAQQKKLWEPSPERKLNSQMNQFLTWLKVEKKLSFTDYHQLWEWSVSEKEAFWLAIWDYFEVKGTRGDTVITGDAMPDIEWFPNSTLNYAENIFKNEDANNKAIIFQSETRSLSSLSWKDLKQTTASIASYLRSIGIKPGDHVVAYSANIHETVCAFLACASIGAVWSSCAPEFGVQSVIDRFQQIKPKVLFAADGYQYNGKKHDRLKHIDEIQRSIPSLEKTVVIPYLHEEIKEDYDLKSQESILWNEILEKHQNSELVFEQLPFNHPLWILYSSGTTGKPKGIVQGHGGILLEHLKFHGLHNDLQKDDRFFWYTTTGWMMWNMVVSGLLTGSTILLYDGNPGYPNFKTLWKFAESSKMTVFGASASLIMAFSKEDISPKKLFDLPDLKAIGSTGSPLPEAGFSWVYKEVKDDIWLYSTSGGTDICSGFLGGSPLLPVYAGELQARTLGVAVKAFNDNGEEVMDEIGELVVTEPMPSMPLYFWDDKNGERYRDSYFSVFPNVWRHGDFLKITPRGSGIIYGRSDATINRGGIRMGTSEIYNALNNITELEDSLIVDIPLSSEQSFMPLFVVLKDGVELTKGFKEKINQTIRVNCSPRHIPNEIIKVEELPKTLNGKKIEVPIKKILMGAPLEEAINVGSLLNPDSTRFFLEYKESLNAKKI